MVAFLLIAAILCFLYKRGISICLFHRLTGLPCLTCGSTRAAVALLSGDWLGAVLLQPLAVLGGLLVLIAGIFYSFSLFVAKRVPSVRLSAGERRVLIGLVVTLAVLNWLYLIWRGI